MLQLTFIGVLYYLIGLALVIGLFLGVVAAVVRIVRR